MPELVDGGVDVLQGDRASSDSITGGCLPGLGSWRRGGDAVTGGAVTVVGGLPRTGGGARAPSAGCSRATVVSVELELELGVGVVYP